LGPKGEQHALLGGFHGKFYDLKKNHRATLGQDALTRISLVIGITRL